MQKTKGHRVNFRIVHCSSQDPQYPATQLLLQSPNCKGWQSKRFSQYPQTIIYELVQPTIIKQISILAHQSKIPTRMIIHNKLDTNKDWHKLGYLSLESNVNSNYQARELKTVNLNDKPTSMLKFTFQTNYVNSHNVFNQIGVISLCVFGDRMISADEKNSKNQTISGANNQLDKLDKNTITKLKQLEIQKKMAIENQDYDQAQVFKAQIDRIKSIGNTLIALQQKKKKAVQNQDFQSAKVINNKIKELRDSTGGGPNFSMRPSGTPTDYFRNKKNQEYEEQPSVSPMTMAKKLPQKQNIVMKRKSPPKKIDDDDRPINVKNTNPYQDPQINDKFPGGRQENQQPGDIMPLSKQIRAQCERYFSVADEQIFMHLFSNHHSNRQRGLGLVKNQLMSGSHNKNQMIEAFLYVVRKMIDDKNIAVLMATLDLYNTGMKKLNPPRGNYSQMSEQILEKLNDYLGHTNDKVKRTTQEIYYLLPQYELTNKDSCFKMLTVLGKRDKPPKILTGRLKMIDTIVGNYQLGKNYEAIINFAVKYADDKNSDVRNSAIALICTLSREIGYASIQPFLKTLRPQIIKSIEEKVQQSGEDNRHYEDKPLPGSKKQAQSIPIKHQKVQQFQAAQNQFIDIPPPKNISNPEYTCQFCERFDKRFQNEDYRDLHMFNACPMLVICEQCTQAVEIFQYTAHRLSQCPNSKYYKKCPRCKEAVHQRSYKAHVQKKQCIPAKGLAVANRCPLCHLDIDPGKNGWIIHLAQEGCENNPRK